MTGQRRDEPQEVTADGNDEDLSPGEALAPHPFAPNQAYVKADDPEEALEEAAAELRDGEGG